MLSALDVVVESIDAVPRGADALTDDPQPSLGEFAHTTELDDSSYLDSAARVIGVIREAVSREDAELLSNLSLVAESLSRNRPHTVVANSIGSSLIEYEVYVWHDADDAWCFAVPELDIEQRNHLQPSNIAWLAASAATLAGGAPATVRLIVGPSTEAVEAPDDAEASPLEDGARRLRDAAVAEDRS